MACIIALVDLSVTEPHRTRTYVLTLLTLAVVACLTGLQAAERPDPSTASAAWS